MMVINVKAKKNKKAHMCSTCCAEGGIGIYGVMHFALQHVKLVDFVREWAWKENDIKLRFEQKRSGVDGDGV
jgi:hypothetical protein